MMSEPLPGYDNWKLATPDYLEGPDEEESDGRELCDYCGHRWCQCDRSDDEP